MFYVPVLVFGGTEGVGLRFHVFHSRTLFQRYRGCRQPFSCFALPKSFSTVPLASGFVFIFCAPGHVFFSAEGVGSRFLILRCRTLFRRYRGRRVPFSCFARPHLFSAVPRSSGPVFMFGAPALVFCGTKGVESRFHILRYRTRFRRCRVRRVQFSCFTPGLFFGATEGIMTRFHVLLSRARFRR
jgi:hypothetical protein